VQERGDERPDPQAISALASALQGRLLRPSDDDYDDARHVWNGMIDKRPALIARCADANDAQLAVRFAADHRLHVSVRCGGHNVSGSAIAEGGLVVDLSGMRAVHVDTKRSTVRTEGGARLGDIDQAAQASGLAVPAGVVSRTGIGGLALHGGMGFLTRRFGLTCDNLLAADVVTADGELRHTDEQQEPDLLWALRGGGGIGVATSLEFRAHPVGPEVWIAIAMYPAADGQRLLRFFHEFMATAPEELMALALYWSAPHDEPIPTDNQGAPILALVGCWSGPVDQGEEAIRPLREQGEKVADLSGRMPFVEAQKIFDPDYPDGRRYYWKSIYVPRLDDEIIEVLHRYAAARPSPISSLDVWGLGGAMQRVAPEATAFFRRNEPYLIGIEANWIEQADDEANLAWVRELFTELERFSDAGAYYNFPGFLEEGDRLARSSFGDNYERLKAIQARYDPNGLFHPMVRLADG
jgi:hypothetical protein